MLSFCFELLWSCRVRFANVWNSWAVPLGRALLPDERGNSNEKRLSVTFLLRFCDTAIMALLKKSGVFATLLLLFCFLFYRHFFAFFCTSFVSVLFSPINSQSHWNTRDFAISEKEQNRTRKISPVLCWVCGRFVLVYQKQNNVDSL